MNRKPAAAAKPRSTSARAARLPKRIEWAEEIDEGEIQSFRQFDLEPLDGRFRNFRIDAFGERFSTTCQWDPDQSVDDLKWEYDWQGPNKVRQLRVRVEIAGQNACATAERHLVTEPRVRDAAAAFMKALVQLENAANRLPKESGGSLIAFLSATEEQSEEATALRLDRVGRAASELVASISDITRLGAIAGSDASSADHLSRAFISEMARVWTTMTGEALPPKGTKTRFAQLVAAAWLDLGLPAAPTRDSRKRSSPGDVEAWIGQMVQKHPLFQKGKSSPKNIRGFPQDDCEFV